MSWVCWLRGHTWVLHLEHGLIYLTCARCAFRTAGWDVRIYDEEHHEH